MATPKKGLGMGLGALMSSNDIEASGNKIHEVDINKINPNKNQPRTNFDENSLRELADSIEEIGIIQPLVVKKSGEFYEIVAGERRWRAARMAALRKVPVIIKEYDDLKTLEAALIENVQREDLNPMEEAYTYVKFSEEFNLSQDEIAKKVGKSRSAVANAMRLVNLDLRVQTFVKEGKISNGHGRTLLGIEDKELQFDLAEKIIDDGLSVRQTEELVKTAIENINKPKEETNTAEKVSVNSEVARECLRISNELKSIFGTKVNIKNNKNKGNGKIEIEYSSIDDLDRIVGMIKEKMIY
ncbi:MAG: ParB/RepB/Spo0J family partition protein [Clostridia bacterium]|nr:ParB/RepB/Spo0J family partition protein [Clostridia bacterium]